LCVSYPYEYTVLAGVRTLYCYEAGVFSVAGDSREEQKDSYERNIDGGGI